MERKEVECCESFELHENLLKIVRETMPEETELYDLAELFKVFGDSTRIRILFVLFEAEVCVCDLASALNMTQSAISHQLRKIRLLFSCRRSCTDDHQSGSGTYRGRTPRLSCIGKESVDLRRSIIRSIIKRS